MRGIVGVFTEIEMQITQENTAELLVELINRKPPHPEETFPVLPLTSASFGAANTDFHHFVDSLVGLTTKSNRNADIQSHYKALSHMCHSLVHAMFRWECVALPTSAEAYQNKDSHYVTIGYTRRLAERVIDVLAGKTLEERNSPDYGYMFLVRKGYRSADGSEAKASCYFPTKQFMEIFVKALYTDFGGWENLTDEYLYRFKDFQPKDIPEYTSYEDKIRILRDYNNFMREQSWAMKNPSYRSFTNFDGRGGRIFNYYQNISNRRYKLRTRTLLNGNIICEPDFNANHLWMFSYICGVELIGDAYAPIVTESGVDRDIVKSVFTRLLGSQRRKQRGGLIRKAPTHKIPCSCDEFKAVEAAALKVYPWLEDRNAFYNDTGAWMQGLEGEIALRMLEFSVAEEIPMLAVHDAFAVNCEHMARTEEFMHISRKVVLDEQVGIRN